MELKRDPVEDTEEYKAVAEEVESMAESLVDPNIRYGRYFFVDKIPVLAGIHVDVIDLLFQKKR